MEKRNRPTKKLNPADPLTEEEERGLLAILQLTNGKSVFPERTAAAKKIADSILRGMQEGRIPKDIFARRK
ncbi:hypothetical protein LZZ85_02685 [Terrimonas sp. NA20]|uniref:Uncharacterized protein n=1 Tax=Terrimonas ginsenosidimutans TaxID=2908004 RepID=A0ABS9KLG0_9BACT|nr:hypothetical protein [Terrimonas ginsenosidimutans]MCG2613162.1 hypothetical protein [Terrimonas ginsenosidimutans]